MIESIKRWAYRMAMLALISVLLIGLVYTFPADVALLFAVDLAAYVEVAFTVYVVAQVARIRTMLALTKRWFEAAYARVRGRTASRPQISRRNASPKAANDEEDRAIRFAA